MCRDMDDSTSLDDMSFEATTGAQRGSSNSVNLSVATTDSSSSSGCELSKTKVSTVPSSVTHDLFCFDIMCALLGLERQRANFG